MTAWLPPAHFNWPAPVFGICVSCGKIETRHGWEAIPLEEKILLFKQNIEWVRKSCSACAAIAPAVSSGGTAPILEVVASR